MKYFTSDTHFGHHNIIGYCHRPFSDVQTMDAAMLQKMQQILTVDDDLYFLGDWCMSHKYYALVKDVPFRHLYFILGNHDKAGKLSQRLIADGIADRVTIARSMTIDLAGQKFHLVHRPLEAADDMPNLCGHVHEKWLLQRPGAVLQEYKYHEASEPRTLKQPILNVGVDQHGFCPISERQVLDILAPYLQAPLPSSTPVTAGG